MKIRFLGASGQVTGSCYYGQAGSARFLVDCGLHQERDFLARNWDLFPFEPRGLDFVLLTHAHLDHAGLLPRLVREGFAGPIHTTGVSAELLSIVLFDSANLQEEDAAYKQKRHKKEGRRGPHPEVPLYTTRDAERVLPLVRPLDYGRPHDLGSGLRATFQDAGHILGAAMIELRVDNAAGTQDIIFSGDIGQRETPIIRDPSVFEAADYIVLESTYGDREHEDPGSVEDMLAEVIQSTRAAGGNVVIPTFAVERAQDLLFSINRLLAQQRIPAIMTLLDSPMAVDITSVFERHRDYMDRETQAMFHAGDHPFRFPGLHLVRTQEESRAINSIRGSCLILAGSGMCTGGRIKHHLAQNISRPESTILFVGYQARGTLGRQILDRQSPVRIHGQFYPVRARIAQIQGFSGHADRRGLRHWLSHFRRPPRRLFLVHGEPEAAQSLARLVRSEWQWPVTIPEYQEEWELA